MYTVNRSWFKYGNEEDEVMITTKEYPTFEKALQYGERYRRGVKFVSYEIEDENGKLIYEEFADGKVFDYRNKEE